MINHASGPRTMYREEIAHTHNLMAALSSQLKAAFEAYCPPVLPLLALNRLFAHVHDLHTRWKHLPDHVCNWHCVCTGTDTTGLPVRFEAHNLQDMQVNAERLLQIKTCTAFDVHCRATLEGQTLFDLRTHHSTATQINPTKYHETDPQ